MSAQRPQFQPRIHPLLLLRCEKLLAKLLQLLALGRAGDHDILVSGSYDRTVRIWDASTGAPLGDPLN